MTVTPAAPGEAVSSAAVATSEQATGERWIEYVSLDQLRPDARNPKLHSVEALRESMERFGFTESVVVDDRTGLLVSGHGRRELLLTDFAAGAEPPEGIQVGPDGSWLVPATRGWSSRDDDEAYAVIVASNRIGEAGGWQRDLLAEGLQRLAALDAGLAGTGYSADDLGLLLAEVASRPEPESPGEFPTIDPATLVTEHSCPRCGYQWSGGQ